MIFATTKERILQFIDYKGISKPKFYQTTGLKRGFLDSDKLSAMVSDVFLAIIIASYPEINIEWLITGKGSMLRSADGEPSTAQVEPKTIYIDNPDKNDLIALQREKIKSLEAEINILKKGSTGGSVVSEDYIPAAVEILSNITHNKS